MHANFHLYEHMHNREGYSASLYMTKWQLMVHVQTEDIKPIAEWYLPLMQEAGPLSSCAQSVS